MRNLYTNLAVRFIQAQGPAFLRKGILPIKLTVASTFKCNHQCRICGIWRVYRDHPEKLKDELTPDDYGRIFSELKSSLLFLDWGGGEPFLRQDMCEIIENAARVCPKLSSFVVTTNGLLTDRIAAYVAEMAGKLKKHQFSIGVSLDGDEETHDHIRGKAGAFKAALQTVRKLTALGRTHGNIEVKISYTLCSLNAGKFSGFQQRVLAPFGMSAGDVAFNLEHVGNLFQTTGHAQETVGEIGAKEFWSGIKHDVDFALEQVKTEHLPFLQRLKSSYRTFFLEKIPQYLAHPDKMVIPCQAARNSLYLDPYGNFYPCVVWGKKLGHYSEGITKILNSETGTNVRDAIEKEKCPICWNACEMIPSLLTSWRLVGCLARNIL